jgi:competence protein ComEC
VSEAFVVTIAAQITTTPLMALTFGRLSLLSLPVNFLIIPAQTPLMVFGGIAVLLALVVWPLGQLFAWLAWLFLSYTLVIVRSFAGLPLASLEVRDVSPGAIWAIYAALFGLTAIASLPEDQRTGLKAWLGRAFSVKVVGSAGLLVAALIGVGAWSLPDGQLHVTVIDVGEGTATLIETPSGRQILVDGGGSGRALSTALGDALPFWDRQLDLLVITQPTRDHVGGLLPTLERYRFDAVLYNGVRGDSDLTQAIWAELDAQGVRGVIALPGMQVAVADGVTLTVLHTQRGPAPEDDPGQPVVLLLAYGDARFLLTGDLTPEGAAALPAEGVRLDATVLQVPVGGQQAMGDEAFLAAVNPQMVVFSMGAGSRSGSPDEAVLAHLDALGTILFRTDQHGTIRLRTDGHTLTVVTARR